VVQSKKQATAQISDIHPVRINHHSPKCVIPRMATASFKSKNVRKSRSATFKEVSLCFSSKLVWKLSD